MKQVHILSPSRNWHYAILKSLDWKIRTKFIEHIKILFHPTWKLEWLRYGITTGKICVHILIKLYYEFHKANTLKRYLHVINKCIIVFISTVQAKLLLLGVQLSWKCIVRFWNNKKTSWCEYYSVYTKSVTKFWTQFFNISTLVIF